MTHTRAAAAPACDAVNKATSRSYRVLWRYESTPPSLERLNAALQDVSKIFGDIGLDFHTNLQTCGKATTLPYELLAAYWYEEQTKVELPSQELLSAMTERLRALHTLVPASNLFFLSFSHNVGAAYKRAGLQPPPDVQSWSDIPIDANTDCRMPYFQDATIRTWSPPAISGTPVGMAYVRVVIDAQGRATDARLASSSGDPAIDKAALDAARATAYYPKTIYCEALPGTYVLRVTFDAAAQATAALLRDR
jgi:TonB family protein